MSTIQTYLYPQTIEVQIVNSVVFTKRNRQVYARPVTVYKGIDNPIQIRVKNQDQQTVDMSINLMLVDIQNSLDQVTEASLGINWINRQKGFGTFTISKQLLEGLTQRQYKLTFRSVNVDSNQERPVFIDDNFGVLLDLIVLPAYYSNTLTPEN